MIGDPFRQMPQEKEPEAPETPEKLEGQEKPKELSEKELEKINKELAIMAEKKEEILKPDGVNYDFEVMDKIGRWAMLVKKIYGTNNPNVRKYHRMIDSSLPEDIFKSAETLDDFPEFGAEDFLIYLKNGIEDDLFSDMEARIAEMEKAEEE